MPKSYSSTASKELRSNTGDNSGTDQTPAVDRTQEIDALTATSPKSRRGFLALFAGLLLAVPRRAFSAVPHPDPRDGIDSSKVLTPEQLKGTPQSVIDIFDMIREIPQIADGIGCNCGCSAMPSYRSLLTCYYDTGMARGCHICQGEAKLVYNRHKEGQNLEKIRRAVDARFG